MPSKKGVFLSDVKSDTAHVMTSAEDTIKSKYTTKEYSDAHKA